jgi:hypothetical protein
VAGVLVSPVICALAAYFPANSILRGAAIETLKPEQTQPLARGHRGHPVRRVPW